MVHEKTQAFFYVVQPNMPTSTVSPWAHIVIKNRHVYNSYDGDNTT